jgi:acyl-ACP thioesterase
MRDFIFYTKEGDVCFRGTSYSVLLNLETRKICRDKNIPFFSLTADEAPLTLGHPTWKHAYGQKDDPIDSDLVLRSHRKVENSFLDLLGHVNNIRYAEFVYDAMTGNELERLKSLCRMEVYFAAELRQSDSFTVSAAEESNRLFFRGSKDGSGEISFDLVFYM